ncbi:FLYWCH zinc finger domain-containing protein [Phthorimaea operculella]|nr:FLYWCH zinc finger domain-containing protein [Phthorimaea operculella]
MSCSGCNRLWVVSYDFNILTVQIQWLTNTRGNPLALLDGYTFSCQRRSASSERWRCSNGRRKCRAAFTVTTAAPKVVVRVNNQHNHPPDDKNIVIMQWLKNARGRDIALLEGFTYYRQYRWETRERWACSSGRRCRAAFTLANTSTNPQLIVNFNNEHNHPPAKNYIVTNGVYIKV